MKWSIPCHCDCCPVLDRHDPVHPAGSSVAVPAQPDLPGLLHLLLRQVRALPIANAAPNANTPNVLRTLIADSLPLVTRKHLSEAGDGVRPSALCRRSSAQATRSDLFVGNNVPSAVWKREAGTSFSHGDKPRGSSASSRPFKHSQGNQACYLVKTGCRSEGIVERDHAAFASSSGEQFS